MTSISLSIPRRSRIIAIGSRLRLEGNCGGEKSADARAADHIRRVAALQDDAKSFSAT
jgi:hypothetical protein